MNEKSIGPVNSAIYKRAIEDIRRTLENFDHRESQLLDALQNPGDAKHASLIEAQIYQLRRYALGGISTILDAVEDCEDIED